MAALTAASPFWFREINTEVPLVFASISTAPNTVPSPRSSNTAVNPDTAGGQGCDVRRHLPDGVGLVRVRAVVAVTGIGRVTRVVDLQRCVGDGSRHPGEVEDEEVAFLGDAGRRRVPDDVVRGGPGCGCRLTSRTLNRSPRGRRAAPMPAELSDRGRWSREASVRRSVDMVILPHSIGRSSCVDRGAVERCRAPVPRGRPGSCPVWHVRRATAIRPTNCHGT